MGTCGARPRGRRGGGHGGPVRCPVRPSTFRLDLAADDPAGSPPLLEAVAPEVIVNCAGLIAGGPDVLAAANVTGPCALIRAMLHGRDAGPARASRLRRRVRAGRAGESTGRIGAAAARRALRGDQARRHPAGRAGRAAGLDAVVLRVFNPVGPGRA